jgi:hypothetical protein
MLNGTHGGRGRVCETDVARVRVTFLKLGLPQKKKLFSLRSHTCQLRSAQGLLTLRTLKHIELSHSYLILMLLSLRLLFKITQNDTHLTWYSRKHAKHIEGQVTFLHHSVHCKVLKKLRCNLSRHGV